MVFFGLDAGLAVVGATLVLTRPIQKKMGEWTCFGTGCWTCFGWGNFRSNTSYMGWESGLVLGTGCCTCFGWSNFRFNTSHMGRESGLVLGLDAELALGGATLDLTPPIWLSLIHI